VRAYKSLAQVERAFRSLKTVDLDIRPVFHWTASRVRAHVFLCLLAYHLEWHLRQTLAPMLFDDHDRAAAEAGRASAVAKAQPSAAAKHKATRTPRITEGFSGCAWVAGFWRQVPRTGRRDWRHLWPRRRRNCWGRALGLMRAGFALRSTSAGAYCRRDWPA
jgi:hypothetical protein